MGQESAEQRCTLARPIGQDLGHQAAIVVVDDRAGHRAEKGEGMDMPVNPGFGHRCRVSSDIAAVTVRQIEHEEVRLLLDTADLHQRFPEIGLGITCRVGQRHEHLPATLLTFPDVILDNRIAAGEPMLLAQAIEHPLGRMALLARNAAVPFEPSIDDRDKPVQLRTGRRRLAPVTGRR